MAIVVTIFSVRFALEQRRNYLGSTARGSEPTLSGALSYVVGSATTTPIILRKKIYCRLVAGRRNNMASKIGCAQRARPPGTVHHNLNITWIRYISGRLTAAHVSCYNLS